MMVPPLADRKEIDRNLVTFFREHRPGAFRRAVSTLCRYFNVGRPRVEWFEYIDWGKTAGKTYEDGRIHLVHPENWKRGRKYKSERMWVQTVYHEMGHYLFWTDAERKADAFQRRMVNGLRKPGRSAGPRRMQRSRAVHRAPVTMPRSRSAAARRHAVRTRRRKPRSAAQGRRGRIARA